MHTVIAIDIFLIALDPLSSCVSCCFSYTVCAQVSLDRGIDPEWIILVKESEIELYWDWIEYMAAASMSREF